jgi:5-methyltetrahydropteroyltriglutamate--homocysteine methyltransferase
MVAASDRILTTHSGSLPRSASFLPLVLAQDAGESVGSEQYRAAARDAVAETVRQQAAVGVDVLNDGEVSKPSYATYIKDRLSGFGGGAQSSRSQRR